MDGRDLTIVMTPLTEAEISQCVPPASTRKTGYNCAALALYGGKLISADFVKYYSDGMVEVMERTRNNAEIAMAVDGSQAPTVGDQGVISSVLQSTLYECVRLNLTNSSGVSLVDTARFVPALPGGRRPSAMCFRFILNILPVGYCTNISFQTPADMKWSGSHSVLLWKRSEKDALLIDFQRGSDHAGKEALQMYASWKASGSVLGQNTGVAPNFLAIRLPPELYDSAGGIQDTFVDYTIRQGLLWGYYGTSEDAERKVRSGNGPSIGVLMSYGKPGVPHFIHGFLHQNAQLRADTYTPLFLKGLEKSKSGMEDVDSPDKFFSAYLKRAPFEIQKRDSLRIYTAPDGKTRYLVDPASPEIYYAILGDTDTSYFVLSSRIYLTAGKSSGGNARRLLSLSKRKGRRSASSSKRRRTHRKPKSRS